MRAPNKLAASCGDTEWTYAQLDRICDQLAAGLAAQGVSAGDRVAILSRNSHAFAALRFAVARLGALLVPINFMLRAHEVAFVLRHSGAQSLCVDAEFVALGQEAIAQDTSVGRLFWLPSEHATNPPDGITTFEQLLASNAPTPQPALDGRTVAQIIYTSGTESLPKGAMLRHEAVIWEYVSCLVDAEITHQDAWLHAMPLFHCAQLDAFLGPAIYAGATNFITSRCLVDSRRRSLQNMRVVVDRIIATS